MIFPDDVVILSWEELVGIRKGIEKLCLTLAPTDGELLSKRHYKALIESEILGFYEAIRDRERHKEREGD